MGDMPTTVPDEELMIRDREGELLAFAALYVAPQQKERARTQKRPGPFSYAR